MIDYIFFFFEPAFMPVVSSVDLANAIRFLSADAVQQAKSGHPGMPMGMSDIATVLIREFLRHNPKNPTWINRDRFVLSNGHGSMLLYAWLHLTGYDVSIDDLKHLRQLHSKTPGHPEYGHTPGVETTTGPLGQGLANAVGMALAESILAAEFNQEKHAIVDHHTYVFMGDGCLMEGISHEVCSLAGTLKLGKLIAFWDDNGISIDGHVEGWFTDNTRMRFKSYGWHVIDTIDGHDQNAVRAAIVEAKANLDQPTLICCRTQIGYGAPNLANTHQAHGAALGVDEIKEMRTALNWPHAPFEIPTDIYQAWDATTEGALAEDAWRATFKTYEQHYPNLAGDFLRRQIGLLPDNFTYSMEAFTKESQQTNATIATRKASQLTLTKIASLLPELLGGSADLTCSNLTNWPDYQTITGTDKRGNYLYYGVREFGMAAIMNGLSLHGGFIPFGGTFLTFSDYMRNAIRMSAIMGQRVIFVFTHDSIGVGEDGPTHQPIEHLSMLRLTPGLSVWRPADATETAVAWTLAIARHAAPTCLAFSRQNVPGLSRTDEQVALIARGAYVLWESNDKPEIILIATGSEVSLALEAAQQLTHLAIRVVSMPSTDVFDAQSGEYRDAVLPPSITKRIAIEAAAKDYWYKYVGLTGSVIGLKRYGVSAPALEAYAELGITVEAIKSVALKL